MRGRTAILLLSVTTAIRNAQYGVDSAGNATSAAALANAAALWSSALPYVVSLTFPPASVRCTGTIVARSADNVSAAILTAPGCIPASTRGAPMTRADWVGRTAPVTASVRAGDAARSLVGSVTTCAFVWVPGAEGYELALCTAEMDAAAFERAVGGGGGGGGGGSGVARWTAPGGARAVEPVPGVGMRVFGYGAATVTADRFGELNVAAGAGALRGSGVSLTAVVGPNVVVECGLVLSGGQLVVTDPDSSLLGAGFGRGTRLCVTSGLGDAGAPIFTRELPAADGSTAWRLAGIAVSASAPETIASGGVATPVLCSEATTRFTSTAFRDTWIRATLARVAPLVARPFDVVCAQSVARDSASATPPALAVAPPSPLNTPSTTPSPTTNPLVQSEPPKSWLALALAVALLGVLCIAVCCVGCYFRNVVDAGETEDAASMQTLRASKPAAHLLNLSAAAVAPEPGGGGAAAVAPAKRPAKRASVATIARARFRAARNWSQRRDERECAEEQVRLSVTRDPFGGSALHFPRPRPPRPPPPQDARARNVDDAALAWAMTMNINQAAAATAADETPPPLHVWTSVHRREPLSSDPPTWTSLELSADAAGDGAALDVRLAVAVSAADGVVSLLRPRPRAEA